MSSQDPTPRDGGPIPNSPPDPGEPTGTTPAVDPLWAPTGAQRGDLGRTPMPMGTPAPRVEPARAPYGRAPEGTGPSPTVAMPSTEVPRVGQAPVGPFQQAVAYDPRPSYEIPVAVQEPVVVVPPRRKPVWPWVVAVFAVVLGGLVGWLVARADDDDEIATDPDPTVSVTVDDSVADDSVAEQLDDVLEQTQASGSLAQPSGIPALDEIVSIDRAAVTASLQNQVDLLSIAQEDSVETIGELEEEIATLEESLAEVTAERDELKAAADNGGLSDSEFLAALQEKEDQISTLQDQLATATTQATEAQAAAQKASEDLRTVQTQLDQANASLAALDPVTLESYVNGDIGLVRADATENGWTVIAREVEVAGNTTPGVVTTQQPAAGTTVVRGAVIYVEYDPT